MLFALIWRLYRWKTVRFRKNFLIQGAANFFYSDFDWLTKLLLTDIQDFPLEVGLKSATEKVVDHIRKLIYKRMFFLKQNKTDI